MADTARARAEKLEQALSLLHELLAESGGALAELPGLGPPLAARPPAPGRISATDRLSWWFRPAAAGSDPWDGFFEGAAYLPPTPQQPQTPPNLADVFVHPQTQAAAPHNPAAPAAPGRWSSLRMVLWEPEEEIFDADAQAVVACLYDFLHAIGNRDVEQALACVADDYHTLENDREIDKQGLRQQITSLLDSLRAEVFDISLVEIPKPIPHPQAILVYVEILVEAKQTTREMRRTVYLPRIAVFKQQPNKNWLIYGLSPTAGPT